MFTLSTMNIKSSLISALLTAILATAGYVIGVGNVFSIDVHALVNVAALSALTAIVSLLKSFLTDQQGNFAGTVKVAPGK